VACASTSACVVVGYRDDNGWAVLLRTSDAGKSWLQLLPG
jgi:hypothetical protein